MGVPVHVHMSLYLLLAWLGINGGLAKNDTVQELSLAVLLFLSILCHEGAHAFIARVLKVSTNDITLYPFGGYSQTVPTPPPLSEVCIALAGPAINLCIAYVLWGFIGQPDLFQLFSATEALPRLASANLILGAINLLPALPLDGGRVLQAVLFSLEIKNYPLLATAISQVLAVLAVIACLWLEQPVLIFIACLVATSAIQEHLRRKTAVALRDYTIRDVMIELPFLHILTHGSTLSGAVNLAFKVSQEWFPVFHGEKLLGFIEREDLLRTTAVSGEEQYLSDIMERDFLRVDIEDNLEEVCQSLGDVPAAVYRNGEFAGILLQEKIYEYVVISRLRAKSVEQYQKHED